MVESAENFVLTGDDQEHTKRFRSMLGENALNHGEPLIKEFKTQQDNEPSQGPKMAFSNGFPQIQSTMTSEMHSVAHHTSVINPPFAHLAYKIPYHMAAQLPMNSPMYMNMIASAHYAGLPKMLLAYPEALESLKPRVFYRNLFHVMHGNLPANDMSAWEGCRVYISDSVGYSGNAKRFKKRAEKGEKALILDCALLDAKEQPINQACLACRDYFETQKYFKTNQDCIGKLLLVKNNSPVSIENGHFKILVKMMCCCVHHSVDFFVLRIQLTSTLTNKIVYSSKVALNVKQWRKSNQKKEECTFNLEQN